MGIWNIVYLVVDNYCIKKKKGWSLEFGDQLDICQLTGMWGARGLLFPSSPAWIASSFPSLRDFLLLLLLLPSSARTSTSSSSVGHPHHLHFFSLSSPLLLPPLRFARETEAEAAAEQLELDGDSISGELQALRWLPSPQLRLASSVIPSIPWLICFDSWFFSIYVLGWFWLN